MYPSKSDDASVRCIRIKLCGQWLGALLVFFIPVLAAAAETSVIPSLELRQEYTDNLFYTSTGQAGSFITRATPGLRLMGQTEQLSGSMAARMSVLHYSANSSMDGFEQFYDGNGSYRATPRLRLSGSAAYRQESWPDREIEISGLALNLTSWHQNYGGGMEYQISEKTVGSFGYGFEQITYSDHNRFSNVASHNVNAAVGHDAGNLLPLLKLRGEVRYSKSDYEMTQVENWGVTVGGSRQFHELWSVSIDGGGRYTRTGFDIREFDPVTGFGTRHDTSDAVGWVLHTSLDYRGELLHGSLAYSRDMSNSSGQFGTAVERDAVTLSLDRRISFELFAMLGAGYYRSMVDRNQLGNQKIDDTSWRGSFSLRYVFNRRVSADVGYDYFYGQYSSSGTTASRNKIFFLLTAQAFLFD